MHYASHNYSASPVITTMPSVPTHHYNTRPAPQRVSSSTTEFRGSTNPDEDWTKISDLAERRRIQNRIAQRNYRKKLKRRLEDLERRAASRSLSPNGDDTDGRSTRESSAEGIVSPPPSSEPHLADSTRENYLPPISAAYTTSGAYPPVYRTASAPYSSAPYYPPITQSEPVQDYSTSPPYLYTYSQPTLSSMVEATCGPSSVSSSGSDHSYLPLPSARLSNGSSFSGMSSSPEFTSPKTPPMVYEENVSPFYLQYSGLSDTPTDPSFFSSQYYHDDQPSSTHSGPPSPPMQIKPEPKH